jgi:hypothetical protein
MRSILLVGALGATLLLPGIAQAQDSVTVPLAAQNNSGINGTATLTQRGADLQVVINLTGTAANSNHPFHIHSGACPTPGGVVHPLTNAVNGTSTTTLTGVTLASVANGAHAINGHESPENLGQSGYIVCGNIQAMAMAQPTAAMPATLPKTGRGGDDPALTWLTVLAILLVGIGLALRTRATAR